MRREPPIRAAKILEQHYPANASNRKILWDHCALVADLALRIGGQYPQCDLDFVEEAAWLHDIGICYTHAPGIECFGDKPYLSHGVIGREICDAAGLPAHGLVCETHVGTGFTAAEIVALALPLPVRDMLPASLEERIICYADQFFSKSSERPWELDEVRRRVAHHGPLPLARFEVLHASFGAVAWGSEEKD